MHWQDYFVLHKDHALTDVQTRLFQINATEPKKSAYTGAFQIVSK